MSGEDFPGGGETGALVRSFDWSTTSLGPSSGWPMSLKSLVRSVIHSRQPMILWWGPELVQIYNDAMLESMRDKHPSGMGKPGREAWAEAWPAVGHELQRVVDQGDAIWNDEMFVPVDRNGKIEAAWWTYSYSPVFDDDGSRAGILIICTETTRDVLARTAAERARRDAESTREELRAVFMQAPVPIAILLGERFTVSLANAAYHRLVSRVVVGRSLLDSFSVDEVGYYLPHLEQVYRTGVPVLVEAAELRLVNAVGVSVLRYIDGSLYPYRDEDQKIIGVISFVNDVTASVTARLDAERRAQEQVAMLEREQALRRAAEESALARDEFLAMLSHELRNPLAPIATAAELMRRRGDPHPEERRIIERQVTHLSQLVDDLLDVARVTRGKLVLHRAPVDLRESMVNAVEQVAPLIAARAHTLHQRPSPEPLLVEGDAVRLAQVVANLLTNAAKYMPRGGRIDLAATREGDAIVLTVADSGPGIDARLLPRVFDMFVQGERDADRSEGGLGIGLALVQHLVKMHGGSVSARNRDHGAELTVRLPALRAHAVSSAAAPESIASAPPATATATAKKILVVDDNLDAATMLAEFLEMFGHDVKVVHDGLSALALLDSFPAAIAFLDIGLPEMDGFELARSIRTRPHGNKMRIAALTGYGQPRDREASANAGFDLHLTKPAVLDDVLRFIDAS